MILSDVYTSHIEEETTQHLRMIEIVGLIDLASVFLHALLIHGIQAVTTDRQEYGSGVTNATSHVMDDGLVIHQMSIDSDTSGTSDYHETAGHGSELSVKLLLPALPDSTSSLKLRATDFEVPGDLEEPRTDFVKTWNEQVKPCFQDISVSPPVLRRAVCEHRLCDSPRRSQGIFRAA